MQTVSFIHSAPELASYRYRAAMPAKEIGAEINDYSRDILVFSKPQVDELNKAEMLVKQLKTIVLDICDDHFGHQYIGPIYRDFLKIASAVSCPTKKMAERIREFTNLPIVVIPDPYEMDEVEPHAEGDKLIWFGHQVNLKAIEPHLNLPNLTIVTGCNAESSPYVPYSKERLDKEMRLANIALFPTMKGHEYKSPNRVINSLRMGLFPVCHKHPSYVEFKRFLWASDVRTGLRWAKEFRSDLNGLVKEGQDYIRDRYSPKAAGDQWRDFLCYV